MKQPNSSGPAARPLFVERLASPTGPARFVGRFGEYPMPDEPVRIIGENEWGLWFNRASGSTGILRAGLDTVSAAMLPSQQPRSAGARADQKGIS